jgi:hypothetical protein
MDRLDDGVRRGRQEAIDLMRSGDWLGFRAKEARKEADRLADFER